MSSQRTFNNDDDTLRRMPVPFDYKIRLHHHDDTLSIVMLVSAASDLDARHQAQGMLREGLAKAHIWREGKLVDSIYPYS